MSKLVRLAIALGCIAFSHLALAKEAFDIKQFAEAFIAAEKAAWERGDFAALEALEHPDVVFQNIDGTVYRGWAAHKAAIVAARASFGGTRMTQEWRYLMGEGNLFAVSYKWTVHLPQRPMVISGMAVGRVKDGKLIEEWGAAGTAPAAAKE
jgi:ketosteroid isomerase-like protein